MEISKRVVVRYGIAFVASFPVAALFAADVDLCFGEKDFPGDDQIVDTVYIVVWIVSTLFAGMAADVRGTFRRACLGFGIVGILLPVAAVVFAITEPSSRDPIFPKSLIFLFCLVVGWVLAVIAWLLARYVPRLNDVWFGAVGGVLAMSILAVVIGFWPVILPIL